MLDNAKNFAKVTVSIGYSATAFSVTLNSGDGAKLPTAPFNVTWWNSTDYADPSDDPNVEIDRVTAVNGDVLTLANDGTTRIAQEATATSTKNTAGKVYKMIAGLTAKSVNVDLPGMFVCNEVVTVSGNTATLAHAPVAGTVQLIGDRNYLYPGTDYNIAGQNITILQGNFSTGDIIANYIKQ